ARPAWANKNTRSLISASRDALAMAQAIADITSTDDVPSASFRRFFSRSVVQNTRRRAAQQASAKCWWAWPLALTRYRRSPLDPAALPSTERRYLAGNFGAPGDRLPHAREENLPVAEVFALLEQVEP